jgi:hypothetical protein
MTTLFSANDHSVSYLAEVEYGGYKLVREPTFMLWCIETADGSQVPVQLLSKFTKLDIAKEFLDKYNESKNKK